MNNPDNFSSLGVLFAMFMTVLMGANPLMVVLLGTITIVSLCNH